MDWQRTPEQEEAAEEEYLSEVEVQRQEGLRQDEARIAAGRSPFADAEDFRQVFGAKWKGKPAEKSNPPKPDQPEKPSLTLEEATDVLFNPVARTTFYLEEARKARRAKDQPFTRELIDLLVLTMALDPETAATFPSDD